MEYKTDLKDHGKFFKRCQFFDSETRKFRIVFYDLNGKLVLEHLGDLDERRALENANNKIILIENLLHRTALPRAW